MAYGNILLIDDDEDDQEIFLTALEQAAPQVSCTAVTNAHNALHDLKKNHTLPDVIFLDLNMPIMSGQEFLRQIKSADQLKSIPVIIFSTSSNAATIAETKALGALDFITKPNRFDLLVDILRSLFTHSNTSLR